MEIPPDILEQRIQNAVKPGLTETGLYHSFRLPDGRILRGSMDLNWQLERVASFGLPEDLHGKTVLDIGPWDGFFTFEMERRGAAVTAIDYVDLDTFRRLHRAFGSKARYVRMDIYELDAERLGTFDIVLCLGALYHFKYPLLALEKICALTNEVCFVDTFVVDAGQRAPLPYMEFYEREELGGQFDNWCGPTVSAVEAMVRTAGFARADLLRVAGDTACIGARRRWDGAPPEDGPRLELTRLHSHSDTGRSFHSNKEEYIKLWCRWERKDVPTFDEVFPEIDGFGIAPLSCTIVNQWLVVSVRVPPGLRPGRHEVRIRIGPSQWSESREFYLDLPPIANSLDLRAIQDSITWQTGEVDWANGGWLTLWADGLSPEADCGNVIVQVAGIPHVPDALEPTKGQINIRLRPLIEAGEHEVRILHRGAESRLNLRVKGKPPQIRGLELLTPNS